MLDFHVVSRLEDRGTLNKIAIAEFTASEKMGWRIANDIMVNYLNRNFGATWEPGAVNYKKYVSQYVSTGKLGVLGHIETRKHRPDRLAGESS